MLDIAQVPGAVELMEAGAGQLGQVADVVQPGRGFQQPGVRAERGRGRDAARSAATPWTCAQRRGSGTSSRSRASRSAMAGVMCMSARLDIRRWTFTDAAGRLETSRTPRTFLASPYALDHHRALSSSRHNSPESLADYCVQADCCRITPCLEPEPSPATPDGERERWERRLQLRQVRLHPQGCHLIGAQWAPECVRALRPLVVNGIARWDAGQMVRVTTSCHLLKNPWPRPLRQQPGAPRRRLRLGG